ncbi:hypothetical protein HMPREF9069_00768 [Atopobium sp. oral taxon 810 str. F0209]|nr:hypothetical protein HMPREF9069_00768 [Atopobium sp. oral taxon 810 str. F0209]
MADYDRLPKSTRGDIKVVCIIRTNACAKSARSVIDDSRRVSPFERGMHVNHLS